jgi:hypothetical protein
MGADKQPHRPTRRGFINLEDRPEEQGPVRNRAKSQTVGVTAPRRRSMEKRSTSCPRNICNLPTIGEWEILDDSIEREKQRSDNHNTSLRRSRRGRRCKRKGTDLHCSHGGKEDFSEDPSYEQQHEEIGSTKNRFDVANTLLAQVHPLDLLTSCQPRVDYTWSKLGCNREKTIVYLDPAKLTHAEPPCCQRGLRAHTLRSRAYPTD